jgi:DNA polymerase-1
LLNLTAAHRDPTIELGGVRSLYCAPPGRVLVHFDFKQIEMRVAAYLSNDEVMIRAVESSDIHSANAVIVFKETFDATEYGMLKKVSQRTLEQDRRFTILDKHRNLAKRSGFAIVYGAEAPTVHAKIVADGIDISPSQVEKMLFELKNAYRVYYRFQDELLHRTIRLGYVSSPFLERKRWVGHAPKPNEVMNFPIQAGAAEHVVGVLLKLDEMLPADALLVNYGYDAATFEAPCELADAVSEQIKQAAERPVELNGHRVVFPIDLHTGERWSELK